MNWASHVSRRILCVTIAATTLGGCGNHDGTLVLPPDGGMSLPPPDGGMSLALPDGGFQPPSAPHIPGLSAPVRAVYDEFGFLHISGKTDADAFAAVGYFHAANRFFLMDYLRHAIRGTLGELISAPGVVDRDVVSRTFFATRQGDPLPEALVAQFDAATADAYAAYARGVNAWLADMRAGRHGATLTEEYSALSTDIRDWEPADSAAVALFSLNDLSNFADVDIFDGQIVQKMQALESAKPEVAETLLDLFLDFRPAFDAYTLPAANQPPPVSLEKAKRIPAPSTPPISPSSTLRRLAGLLDSASRQLRSLPGAAARRSSGDVGSNNWVIAGSRTLSGAPLLASDPHLQLTNPSIWFPLEIDGKTGGTGHYHAAGGSFPGIPTIQIGHNESIAWGTTVAYWDLADVYLEQLTSETTVLFNGESVPIIARAVDFVDQGATVTKTLAWVPQHGPIVSLDATSGSAVTIRWRGHDGGTDAQASLELGLASSVSEAKAALANVTVADQNYLVADAAGEIGYFPYSQVPIRTWAGPTPGSDSPFFPLPGDGTREWGPGVALADLPQLQNPPAGFIATANGDITGASSGGDPLTPPPGTGPIQTIARAEGTRLQRILDSINATGTGHTLETMRQLQGDTQSLVAATIVPYLVSAAASLPEGGFQRDAAPTAAIVAALAAYQAAGTYTCPTGLDGLDPVAAPNSADPVLATEAIGCAAFHTTLYALFEAAFGDELHDPQVDIASALTTNTVPLLLRSFRDDGADPGSEPFWVDQNADHPTTRNEIVQRALTKAGAVLATYGGSDDWRWGRMHTLTLKSPLSQPGVTAFDSGPYATPGGVLTVNVATPSAVDLDDTSAAARQRFAHTTGASMRMLVELGPGSPHMQISLPGGADLHRDSPFYGNMLPRWQSNTPVDFAFGAGSVEHPSLELELAPE
jgi:penicillin amidase